MKRQVNYNKIASNLFKYSFDFDLTVNETYENFSKEYPDIYNIFLELKKSILNFNDNIPNSNPTPFLIQDNESESGVYLIESCIYRKVGDELVIEGFNINKNKNNIITFNYTFNDDTLDVTVDQDEFLTSDNLKSVFNQSLVGTGNVTLYRHVITITTSSQDFILLEYISSKKLKVDSVQDLRTLCGNNFTLPVEGVYQVGQDTFYKVVKLVSTSTTLDLTTIKSDGTLQTLSALTASLNDVVTTI